MQWEIVIGLETHAQLSTASKIFSGSSTAFGAEPNSQANVLDLALPGTLPVLNRGAVQRAIQFGLAIGATIAPRSIFARKNYFYPDLPKGYQISQYEIPVVQGGTLTFVVQPKTGEPYVKTVNLTRAHLEEDAGKSLHEDFHGHVGHRPQPRRHAAAGNRLRAGHALVGGGGGVRQGAALAGRVARRVRRQHAGRQLPLRRQRLGAAGRRDEARHALRDQEPEQLPVPREGDRVRGAAPGRADRGRRHRRPGNAPVRPGPRRDALDAEQGRRDGLSLLPGSRPAAAGDRAGVDRAGQGGACPNCPARCASASCASTGCRTTRRRR